MGGGQCPPAPPGFDAPGGYSGNVEILLYKLYDSSVESALDSTLSIKDVIII